jgi:hypothetical protein
MTPPSATAPPASSTGPGTCLSHTREIPIAVAGTRYRLSVARPTSIRAIAYAHNTNPTADGAIPRKIAEPIAAPPACGSARNSDPVHGRMNRRGGDRKPAVRVVLDAVALAASAETGYLAKPRSTVSR